MRIALSFALGSFLLTTGAAFAQDADSPAPDAPKKLIVGTKPAPPFSFKKDDGSWTGISIELWRDIARDMKVDFEIREYDLKGLLDNVENASVDVGVAAVTITAEREQKFDFTHPFYSTGLGIAVPSDGGGASPLSALLGVFSGDFLRVIGLLCLLLLAVGVFIWLLERKGNPDEFAPGIKGVGDGFWWSAVTMTTVGYGDAAPKSFLGRILGLIWMFAAILIISFFTAQITSALTVSQLESGINGPEDLPKVKVGCVDGSSPQRYLGELNVRAKGYPTIEAGMAAVASKEIDAFVHDRPILQFYANGKMSGAARVLDPVFDPQTYGIALPPGSELREPLNTLLLKRKTDEDYWNGLTARFLGTRE